MGCKQPLLRVIESGRYETASDGHKYQKARIERPSDINERIESLTASGGHRVQLIPCRKCMGCRLDYSREWANRGFLESQYHKNNYFVTLTYNDENLLIPDEVTTKDGVTYDRQEDWKGILQPEHIDGFIHDLRQHYRRNYNQTGIKYMLCGEYGDEGARPHYHAIFFNLPLEPSEFYNTRIINQEMYWQHKTIEKYWKHGISNVTAATWNNIAYTARYITKKINGKQSEDYYAEKGQIKEIWRVSKGIGKSYYDDHKEELIKKDTVLVKNKNGAISTKIPKYYDRLLEKENKKILEAKKKKREKLKRSTQKIKLQNTSNNLQQQLFIEEQTLAGKAKILRRSYQGKEQGSDKILPR